MKIYYHIKEKRKKLQCVFAPCQDLSMFFFSVLPCYLQENSVCVQSFPYLFLSSQCWFSVVLYSTGISAFIISSSSAPGHGNHAFIFESKSGMILIVIFLHNTGVRKKIQSTNKKCYEPGMIKWQYHSVICSVERIWNWSQ